MTTEGDLPDPQRLAGGGAVLGGLASLVAPYFLGLCVAASALFALAWLLTLRRPTRRWPSLLGAGTLAAGWSGYGLGGPILGRFAAVPLLLTVAVLWRLPSRPPPEAGGLP